MRDDLEALWQHQVSLKARIRTLEAELRRDEAILIRAQRKRA